MKYRIKGFGKYKYYVGIIDANDAKDALERFLIELDVKYINIANIKEVDCKDYFSVELLED